MTTHDPTWGENGRPARRLLRRQEASRYLAEHWGIVRSSATFAKYAVTGGGPRWAQVLQGRTLPAVPTGMARRVRARVARRARRIHVRDRQARLTPMRGDEMLEPPSTGPASGEDARAILLELTPVRNRPGRYSAHVDGRCVVRGSRQPFFDAARALRAGGVPDTTVIEARHAGSATIAMRSTVGEAAKWAIEETDRGGLRRRPWKPPPAALLCRDGVAENARDDIGVGKGPPEPSPASTDTRPEDDAA
jgi:hypothetical protein